MAGGARPRVASPIRRRDPNRRNTQAGVDPTKLIRTDPLRKYKLVHPDDRSTNSVRNHEHRGWEIERGTKGGVMLERGACSKEGEAIEMDGYVLMSIAREEFERIEREGYYGNGGQESLDDIEDQIIDPSGPIDASRGQTARIASFQNETKALSAEI